MEAVFWGLIGLMLALSVTVLYLALVPNKEKPTMIRTERVMTNITPVPVPPETWVRYAVNLDEGLQKYVQEICREYGVAPSIVFAVIEKESDCDPNCIGDNGHSKGLMQIWEDEHLERMERLGITDLLDPEQNILCGVDLIAELQSIYNGNMKAVLTFYNGSSAYADKVLARAEQLAETTDKMEEINNGN